MFFEKNRRRSQQVRPTAMLVDALESRQLLSATTQLEAVLSGSTTATGTAEFETTAKHGVQVSTFELHVNGATASTSYDIQVAGISVGSLTTDATGNGLLKFSSQPDKASVAFPKNFPVVGAGAAIDVVGLVNGSLATGVDADSNGKTDEVGEVGENNEGGETDDAGEGTSTQYSAALTGATGATGTASYQTETERGLAISSFTVNVTKATGSTSFDVHVAGTSVGSLTTDATGNGSLKLSSQPGSSSVAFPGNWPAINAGSAIDVVGLVNGTLQVSTDNDVQEGEQDERGSRGERDDKSESGEQSESVNSTELGAVLSGTTAATGTANFESETRRGTPVSTFVLRVNGAAVNNTYAVEVAKVNVGSFTTDINGNATLRFSSQPRGTSVAFPANWQAVGAGTTVDVVGLMNGMFAGGEVSNNQAFATSKTAKIAPAVKLAGARISHALQPAKAISAKSVAKAVNVAAVKKSSNVGNLPSTSEQNNDRLIDRFFSDYSSLGISHVRTHRRGR